MCLLKHETQACLVDALGQSRCRRYEMVRVANGNLATVVDPGGAIDTSVCSLSTTHVVRTRR